MRCSQELTALGVKVSGVETDKYTSRPKLALSIPKFGDIKISLAAMDVFLTLATSLIIQLHTYMCKLSDYFIWRDDTLLILLQASKHIYVLATQSESV